MPPKRTAKRKASDSGSGGEELETPTSKRAKALEASADSATTAENGQPTNKVLPVNITFPKKAEGRVRLASWNICSLAAAQKKGFKYYVEAEDPDILILTETKVNNEPVDPALADRFPHRHWAISDKKSYSGVAVLSKIKPLSVTKTLPGHPDPALVKGRILTLEFDHMYVVGTYVVNAGEKLKTLDAKKEWNTHFEAYIRELDEKKPVIWGGDLNVAPTELDLANPKRNWNKTAGYTEVETSSFARILNSPDSNSSEHSGRFVDIWRQFHPTDKHYTYFSYRFNCRAKGLGWRIDMFVLSQRIVDKAKMCEIRSEIYGASDHCPLVMEIEGEL